ncbi:MAG: hypothetical protein J3R72DRAFT_514366 [Linnemannia gamsii]|nr:MAG: hypothetical protein J3R72DRAFT_514366 [Linnemannia gamsii]
MDVPIFIESDVYTGIVTSMLLAIVGGFIVAIVQSAREGVTIWLYKHFPKNRGKLYVMATSRAGSYLDVLGLFKLLGGFPMFTVLLLLTIGLLGQAFSETTTYSSVSRFVLQGLNNTITSALPWALSNPRGLSVANFPAEIHKIPLERLSRRVEFTGISNSVSIYGSGLIIHYMNGTSVVWRIGGIEPAPDMDVYNGWFVGNADVNYTDTASTISCADSTLLFSAVETNLNANLKVLGNHSWDMRAAYRQVDARMSNFEFGDLLSYVATCFAMAVSQTRPIGMIKGYEHADIIAPVISINFVLAIPLLLVLEPSDVEKALATAGSHTVQGQMEKEQE